MPLSHSWGFPAIVLSGMINALHAPINQYGIINDLHEPMILDGMVNDLHAHHALTSDVSP